MAATKTPNSRRNLDEAIRRAFGADYLAARTTMVNAIVGSLLSEGVVKGGSALKLRFGNSATRFTTDLDATRVRDMDIFVGRLEDRSVVYHSGQDTPLYLLAPSAASKMRSALAKMRASSPTVMS